jgi:rare lipoprotein A (peptidoglycan hydrolase)
VTLIDACACGHGRVVDLYRQAFRRLAPLSQGVVGVMVTWGGEPPATDTE